ncbi:UNVERIFIED_CONTAM: hypothetical protein NCL1_24189 [Trichonephila clavipes]
MRNDREPLNKLMKLVSSEFWFKNDNRLNRLKMKQLLLVFTIKTVGRKMGTNQLNTMTTLMRNNLLQVLAASKARFLQFQRNVATLCHHFQHHLYPHCWWSSSCSRSHRILKCVSSGLVVFRASPDVAEPSQSVTSDDLSNLSIKDS